MTQSTSGLRHDPAGLSGEIVPGGHYRHYKGGEFVVLTVGTHIDTGEELVVYRVVPDTVEVKTDPVFIRPKADFLEMIPRHGYRISKFVFIGVEG